MRTLLPAIAALLAGTALGLRVADRPPDWIPPPAAPAAPTSPDRPATIQAVRVEVVDPSSGAVLAVLTSEGGVPVAVVNDQGIARRIDLAKVARLIR